MSNVALCGHRCPKEVYPHVPTVISICLRYLTYDPNYNFDDEDEDDNAMDAEQNDEDYQGAQLIARTSVVVTESRSIRQEYDLTACLCVHQAVTMSTVTTTT